VSFFQARNVGFRFWGQSCALERPIREALTKAGVAIGALENTVPARYVIVAFGEIDSGLIELLHDLRLQHTSVLAVAAFPALMEKGVAWRLLHAGVADLIIWDSPAAAEQILAKLDRWQTIDDLMAKALAGESLAGESTAWLGLLRKVVEAGRFSSAPVLLTGESGTGKEILARLIHRVGQAGTSAPRRELVTVDCSTLTPELSGSELFGHERGAFTGAHTLREGAFALADGATLFLDEVGELPLPLQAQLLRAIQEKTYKRVGANVWQKTDFRLVCATNRDLADLVQRGQFRLDLFHRIAGWVFRTLPVAERRGDILPLALHFLRALLPETPGFDEPVREYLLNRMYAGNIRELRQLVHRMANRHVGPGPITAGDIPEEDRPQEGSIPHAWPDERLDRTIADAIALGASLREISAATTTAAIRIAVQSEQGNLQRAAKRLGVTDRALQMRRAAGKDL
jgi:transcriptional regulator with GAF, ATPase, and Fis domain